MTEYNELEKATRKYFATEKVTNSKALIKCMHLFYLVETPSIEKG